jgi:hypothetical protein
MEGHEEKWRVPRKDEHPLHTINREYHHSGKKNHEKWGYSSLSKEDPKRGSFLPQDKHNGHYHSGEYDRRHDILRHPSAVTPNKE